MQGSTIRQAGRNAVATNLLTGVSENFRNVSIRRYVHGRRDVELRDLSISDRENYSLISLTSMAMLHTVMGGGRT